MHIDPGPGFHKQKGGKKGKFSLQNLYVQRIELMVAPLHICTLCNHQRMATSPGLRQEDRKFKRSLSNSVI